MDTGRLDLELVNGLAVSNAVVVQNPRKFVSWSIIVLLMFCHTDISQNTPKFRRSSEVT